MANDHYNDLTPAEQCYWDVYTRLRSLSDWPGFTYHQQTVQGMSRTWLVERRKEIWRLAQPASEGGDGKGWDANKRRERYEQLKDDNLNTGDCRRLCQLPTNGNTQGEKVIISEREMWWNISSVDPTTKAWRLYNVESLIKIRKQIYTLAEQEGWEYKDRKLRWRNLCVATKTGSPYEVWKKTHDPETGEENEPDRQLSSRAQVVKHARSFLGLSESPPGSNKGGKISEWQKRVIGADGYAWCACFTTCMAWDVGVKGGASAAVVVCMNMAKRGEGMFRGWTTDPSKVRRGDFAVIGCSTCHIALVRSNDNPYLTIEGNTSPASSGSQYNGGCVAEKNRAGQIIGWCLVDYP